MRAAVDAVRSEDAARSACSSTTPATASRARSSPSRSTRVRAQFETNVFGLVRMCQLVLPGMREQRWGKIVNVSSMGGRFTFPGGGLYHATQVRGRGDLATRCGSRCAASAST